MADQIKMEFPADPGYISPIRLALSGIAGHMDYKVDDIEDIKSCVSEACLLLMTGQKCTSLSIVVDAGNSLTVSVQGDNVEADLESDFEDFNEEISRIMIETLSDQSTFVEENGLLCEVEFDKQRAAS